MKVIINRKTIIMIMIVTMISPIIVNVIVQTYIPIELPEWLKVYGNSSEWLSFFANYSGGIVGGITAYIIARMQIIDNKNEQDKNNYKDQINTLEIIKLDFKKILKAFSDYSTLIDSNESTKSIGQYPLLSKDIWGKLGAIDNGELQTKLFQAHYFYNDIIESLNTDIILLEDSLRQINKTTQKMSSIRLDIDQEVQLINLNFSKLNLVKEINYNKSKRNAAQNLIKSGYINSLKEIEVDTNKYTNKLKSLLDKRDQ